MENNTSLKQFTKKVEALVRLLQEKDAKIALLEAEKEELRKEIKLSYAENVELQNKYDNLQIAQALISLSNKDVARAKAKLTTMMKTIDRCIEKIDDNSHE
ncbi:MAG: hypothetical protein UIC45_05205 [Paludibacteraceae bacterium]|nr:hypothetical protein [Paludibacteraceae bacterium]